MAYARALEPDHIMVLSAKHGAIDVEETIEPYDQTLNRMPAAMVRDWSERVLCQLGGRFDLQADRFTCLAGDRYRRHLVPYICHAEVPMRGLTLGRQLQFLTRALSCARLHRLLWTLDIHGHPIDAGAVPRNGIYVVFERGEPGHGGRRIVRAGTHTGHNQLPSRLRQHFVRENEDRSIFRKNIGRALLASTEDPYLDTWNLDLTAREARKRYGHLVDEDHQAAIERRVTEYMQANLQVACLEVPAKENRLALESRLVSTVSLCPACGPSAGWLGGQSPKQKIRASGLWQVNELYKEPLRSAQLDNLEDLEVACSRPLATHA